MNHQSLIADPRAPRWEHETAMLASSMMLVSISEGSPSENVGFKSRLCPSSGSRIGSGSSLSGWGTAATRKSCKMDLCALAEQESALAPSSSTQRSVQPTRRPVVIDQGWGFYAGGDLYSIVGKLNRVEGCLDCFAPQPRKLCLCFFRAFFDTD